MNDRRTEVAPAPRSAAFGSTVIPGCACLPIAPHPVVTTHRIGGNLTCAMSRHLTQSRLSSCPVADSFRDQGATVSLTTQAPAPIGLTNPRTLIHTASLAEEDQ